VGDIYGDTEVTLWVPQRRTLPELARTVLAPKAQGPGRGGAPNTTAPSADRLLRQGRYFAYRHAGGTDQALGQL
jgi:hypothetical protein